MEPVFGSLFKGLRLIDLIDSGLLSELDFELVHFDDADAPYATVCGIKPYNLPWMRAGTGRTSSPLP